MTEHIDIVFDGPPDPVSGRFVEVENSHLRSVELGEWVERDDGYWVLRFTLEDVAHITRMAAIGPLSELYEEAVEAIESAPSHEEGVRRALEYHVKARDMANLAEGPDKEAAESLRRYVLEYLKLVTEDDNTDE